MDNDITKAKALLQKYREGTCTPEEKAWIAQWYLQLNTHETDLSDDEFRVDLLELKKRLQKITAPKPQKLYPWRIAAAILVFVSISIGMYWYFNTGDAAPQLASEYGGDALPGGNRATLTLADGRVLDLSEAHGGIVVGDEVTYEDGSEILDRRYETLAMRTDSATEGSLTSHISRLMSLTTPNGGQYHVVLPDGSKVWLNAASSLTYPTHFGDAERRVVLHGEGYFEVAKNTSQPFIVESEGQEIKVLGTEFNIHAYPKEPHVYTTLFEGSISVQPTGARNAKMLIPGQQSRLSGRELKLVDADIDQVMGWKEGFFIFRNTNLKSVLEQLARWYDIEIAESDIPEEYFLGEVSRQSKLSEILAILELNSRVKFRLEGRRLMIEE